VVSLLAADVELMDAALTGDEALAEALGHPVVPGWISFTEALPPTREALAADPSRAIWGARLFLAGEPPELVGWGGFKGPPDEGFVEIGYEIAASRRRQGLATAAVEAMLA
jgi:RimJ/RimL family protein N-acetyltransferase